MQKEQFTAILNLDEVKACDIVVISAINKEYWVHHHLGDTYIVCDGYVKVIATKARDAFYIPLCDIVGIMTHMRAHADTHDNNIGGEEQSEVTE